MGSGQEKIDFVITWVDGSDPVWFAEKQKYEAEYGIKSTANRFRDWENLKYLFRGIERFAPWVNRVHFITCGHLPDWLNTEHPKLNIVRHEDYIPAEYLPTFSSHPIELNMHRIEGLSSQFVYFNDDMFLIAPVKETDFFKNGLPRGAMGFEVINPSYDSTFFSILGNNMRIINENFTGNSVLKQHFGKVFNLHYDDATYIKSLLLLPWCTNTMTGFINFHLPCAYRKEIFDEVWEKEGTVLAQTSGRKFRSPEDVSPYLFCYWQYVTGRFVPINMKRLGSFYYIKKQQGEYDRVIRKQKGKMICLNDDMESEDTEEYIRLKKRIIEDFDTILGEKSRFER